MTLLNAKQNALFFVVNTKKNQGLLKPSEEPLQLTNFHFIVSFSYSIPNS